jgi:hypothetical protein
MQQETQALRLYIAHTCASPYQNQADLSRTLRIGTFPNHKKIILNCAKYPHEISEYLQRKNTIFDIPFVVFIFYNSRYLKDTLQGLGFLEQLYDEDRQQNP